jgi:hypothetical protein
MDSTILIERGKTGELDIFAAVRCALSWPRAAYPVFWGEQGADAVCRPEIPNFHMPESAKLLLLEWVVASA